MGLGSCLAFCSSALVPQFSTGCSLGEWPTAGAQSLLLAHITFPGGGNFINGVLHPIATPTHLILLVAVILFLGQSVPLRMERPILWIPLAGVTGLAGCLWMHSPGWWPVVLSVAALGVSLSAVCAFPLTLVWRAPLAALAIFLIGLDSSSELTGRAPIAAFTAGTAMVLIFWTLNAAYYVSCRPDRPWAHIGLRIVSAWIAAVSIMMLAFELRR